MLRSCDCPRVVVTTIGTSPSSVLLWNTNNLGGNYMIIGGYLQTLFTNDYQFRNQFKSCAKVITRSFQLVSDRFLRDISESYYSDPASEIQETSETNETNSKNARFYSAAAYFYRHPVNCALRDSYSDIYMNVYSSDDVPSQDELGFYQQYRIIPYVGSRQKEKIVYESFIGEDNPLHDEGPFDVTIISQTSYGASARPLL